jgi:hypothetical protein
MTTIDLSSTAVVDLSNRELSELPQALRGGAGDANMVRELVLAFNKLSSLLGLVEACPMLERLVASHNKLRTLPALGSLSCLCRLDLSHNRLTDIAALGGCPSLAELWLSSNQLELPALLPLGSLPALRDLVILGNPCASVSPSGLGRRVAILLLPELASIDAQPISVSSRAEAATFMQAAGSKQALQAQLGPKQTLALLRSGPARHAASRSGGGGSSSSSRGYGPPSRRRLQGISRGGACGSTCGSSAYSESCFSGGGGGSPTASYAPHSPGCGGDHGAIAEAGLLHSIFDGDVSDGRGSPGKDERCVSGGSAHGGCSHAGSPAKSCSGGSLFGGSSTSSQRGSQSGERRASSRRAAQQQAATEQQAAGQHQRAAALADANSRLEDSERALAAVVASLPPAPTRHAAADSARSAARFGRRSSAGRKEGGAAGRTDAPLTVPASETEHQLFYPKGGVACVVRADGSCVVRWPGGGVAVAVEHDAPTPLGFRLSASYRRGGKIAATFDGHGSGFAYRPDGTLALSHHPSRGGCLTDSEGSPLRAWGAAAAGGGDHAAGGGGVAGERLSVALGDCMALIFDVPSAAAGAPPPPRIAIAFKCDGFRQLIVHSANAQGASWDPALDTLDAVSGLHGPSRPIRRGRPQQNGASVPPSLAQAGGPRAGLGGIQDALALLPDLKMPSRIR